MLTPRPYQTKAIEEIYRYFEEKSGNPLVVCPTGSGKSLIQAEFLRRSLELWPDERFLLVTHVKELIQQNAAEIWRQWPGADIGIYCAGLGKKELGHRITMASIQSIAKKATELGAVSMMIIDEVHLCPHSGTGRYRTLISELRQFNPHMKVLGLTATPYRLGSGYLHQGEGAIFSDIAHEVEVADLVPEYLSPLTNKEGGVQADLSKVHIRGGEFIEKEAAEAMLEIVQTSVADIVTRCADRKKWLIFCTSIEHAEAVTAELIERGVSCEAVHSKISKDQRAGALRRFDAGEVRAISNVDCLTTGFNQPDIDALIILRPTMSPGLHVQIIGRSMRKSPGKKEALILDYAGNLMRHGPIGDVRVDTKGRANTRKCANCDEVLNGKIVECPACGDVLTKTCRACKNPIRADLMECPECGEDLKMGPRTVKHEERPDVFSEVLAKKEPIKSFQVSDVRYRKHTKPGKPPSLRVDYACGINTISEWVCVEHDGYAQTKAKNWWRERNLNGFCPQTTDDALLKTSSLKRPKKIRVDVTGKYDQIIGYEF